MSKSIREECYQEVIDDLYNQMEVAFNSGKNVSFPTMSDEWIAKQAKKKNGKVILKRIFGSNEKK